ncbi:MAG: VWA domain-containing protein [Clostridia bacterium]|nr:VWA domain-containing protein [Clostridia bacterium]
MTLLYPIGLLGLLGIVALIIIYIIKPNYQQKAVSSTFIWKLALKYRKRKLPTSNLRNLLIIICQILILAILALVLTKPSGIIKAFVQDEELVAIIDASSSMRTLNSDEDSRFKRAVEKAKERADAVFEAEGVVTVIIADDDPYKIGDKIKKENKNTLYDALDKMVTNDECSYSVADVDAALRMTEDILQENPSAKVVVFSDTEYAFVPESVEVVNIWDGSEWNAAILNATAELEDGYYTFTVDVACYGRDMDLPVKLMVYNKNSEDKVESGKQTVDNVEFNLVARCEGDARTRIVFRNADKEPLDYGKENIMRYDILEADKVHSYESINVALVAQDSYKEDNSFDIYGGKKETVNIIYNSSKPNPFFQGVLDNVSNRFSDRWDIHFREASENSALLEGYKPDIYVFEHRMPDALPRDGIVIVCDPETSPINSGFRVNSYFDLGRKSMPLVSSYPHPIMNNIIAERITVSRYDNITYLEPNYDVLASYSGRPVIMAKKIEAEQVVILGFNMHYSNMPVSPYFPLLMSNIINYYMPPTVYSNAFEVNEVIALNSRGFELTVSGNMGEKVFNEFPATLKAELPGTYTLQQTTYFGDTVTENIFVKVPASESNIWAEGDALYQPKIMNDKSVFYKDLLLYFAIGLVALLFAEWWLHMRESKI